MRNPLPFTRNPLLYGSTDLQTNDRPQFLPDIKNIVGAFLGMGWITTKVAWKGSIMVKLVILSKQRLDSKQPSSGLFEVPPFLSSRPAREHL